MASSRSSSQRGTTCLRPLKRSQILCLTVLACCLLAVAQPALVRAQQQTPSSAQPPTFKVTTKIVVAQVLAIDGEGQPVEGLSARDFQVFDQAGNSGKLPQTIASFRIIPRTYGLAALGQLLALPHRSRCWVPTVSSHYELAYYPDDSSQSLGVHHIIIKSRRGVRLIYRTSYIMTGAGAPAPPPNSSTDGMTAPDPALMAAACSSSPLASARLSADFAFTTDRPDRLDYFLALDPLEFKAQRAEKGEYQIGMDFAACAKDAAGKRLYDLQTKLGGLLTEEEYQSVQDGGFPVFVGVDRVPDLASVRLVFRDHVTGRVSAVSLNYGRPEAGKPSPQRLDAKLAESTSAWPPGVNGVFGTSAPYSPALCGDLYVLTPGFSRLPVFSELNSIGAIYANALNVPDQYYGGTYPDPTSSPDFGIDYHGTFFVKMAGKYEFIMLSDDGSKLFIDGRLVVDNDGAHNAQLRGGDINLPEGWHAIRVEYFQGMPVNVALGLWVKGPGHGGWALFDTRSFQPNSPR